MSQSHGQHKRSWRGSPRRNSPTLSTQPSQHIIETQAPQYTSNYTQPDATHSQVEHAIDADLQLLRTRRASFAPNSLANALGDTPVYTEPAHNEAVAPQPSPRLSRSRSSAAGKSTRRHSTHVTSPYETVFSIGHEYHEQWKNERSQPRPVASSSKAPRTLATNPKAIAARRERGIEAQDLVELNNRLPYPWHVYKDPLTKRVIPAATEYIDELSKTIKKNDADLKKKNGDIEWYESALGVARTNQDQLFHEVRQLRSLISGLRTGATYDVSA
ncbi:hypothetical protein DENSPDRAFT_508815 [Dentipellis sp. KUC8613]|nr:hypothetical protein DENSPDRAFT_508815 [Dentipellis sp. KUC8613]